MSFATSVLPRVNAGLFVLGLVAGGVLFFTVERSEVSEGEKRKLAQMPPFSWQAVTHRDYFRKIDDFVADNFAFRYALTELSGEIRAARGWPSDDIQVFTSGTRKPPPAVAAPRPDDPPAAATPEPDKPQATAPAEGVPTEPDKPVAARPDVAPAEPDKPEPTPPAVVAAEPDKPVAAPTAVAAAEPDKPVAAPTVVAAAEPDKPVAAPTVVTAAEPDKPVAVVPVAASSTPDKPVAPPEAARPAEPDKPETAAPVAIVSMPDKPEAEPQRFEVSPPAAVPPDVERFVISAPAEVTPEPDTAAVPEPDNPVAAPQSGVESDTREMAETGLPPSVAREADKPVAAAPPAPSTTEPAKPPVAAVPAAKPPAAPAVAAKPDPAKPAAVPVAAVPPAPPAPDVKLNPPTDPYEVVEAIIVYRGRALQIMGGTPAMATPMINAVNRYQQELGPEVTVYFMAAPIGSDFYLPEKVHRGVMREKILIDGIHARLNPGVRAVRAYDRLSEHTGEYLYFNTDHHWTGLGAYYAYTAFAQAARLSPLPLSALSKGEIGSFLGTLYYRTMSPALKAKGDTVEYYKIPHRTEVSVFGAGSRVGSPGMLYVEWAKGGNAYGVFLGGDFPLMRVKSDVNNGRRIVVIKDSYGNAFVPYLAAHYQEVFVIDYRSYKGNIKNLIREHGIQDVLFAHNTFVVASGYAAQQAAFFLDSPY